MRMIPKALIAVSLLVSVCMVTTACGIGDFNGTEGDPSKASFAVMYTHDSKDRTIIQWLDDDQNVVGESKYPYSGAMISFENASVDGSRICIAPEGPFGKKDEKCVAIIDTSDGSYKEIELSTTNHVSCNIEDDLMAVSGNLNGEGSIDLIDTGTDDVRTYTDTKLWDDGIMQVALVNGTVYGCGEHGDGNGIYKIDVDQKKTELVYKCKDDPQEHSPTYLCRHGDDLVFLDDRKLIKNDTKTGDVDSFELSRDDYTIVNITGDRVWLGYTDQHSSEYDSLVEVREYDSGRIIDKVDVDASIWQLEPGEDTVYLLLGDYNMARKFTFEGNELSFVTDIVFDPKLDDYSYGGIFALEK